MYCAKSKWEKEVICFKIIIWSEMKMAAYNYKITIQYDGTKYRGWQVQRNTDMTIQGKLQTLITRLLGYDTEVIGSGRTDAGVHAIGQVANFHTKECIDEKEFARSINSYLPEDIAVISIEKVDGNFHARYSATEKTYRYRIYTGEYSNVFERKYLYNYKGNALNVDAMREAAGYMLGEHDFKSFCGNRHMKKSTVRNVMSINIIERTNEIDIEYTGNGFLQNMVRIMTGTLIEVGNGARNATDIPGIIDRQDREYAGYTAPASGLCLVNVKYE